MRAWTAIRPQYIGSSLIIYYQERLFLLHSIITKYKGVSYYIRLSPVFCKYIFIICYLFYAQNYFCWCLPMRLYYWHISLLNINPLLRTVILSLSLQADSLTVMVDPCACLRQSPVSTITVTVEINFFLFFFFQSLKRWGNLQYNFLHIFLSQNISAIYFAPQYYWQNNLNTWQLLYCSTILFIIFVQYTIFMLYWVFFC